MNNNSGKNLDNITKLIRNKFVQLIETYSSREQIPSYTSQEFQKDHDQTHLRLFSNTDCYRDGKQTFRTTEVREELVQIAESLANYLHEKEIKNIIFVDRSARPGYIGLIKVWHKMFPEQKRPNIYFVNPYRFKERKGKVLKELKENYPNLVRDKKDRTMIFDACLHTGLTISPIIKTLKKAGFKTYAGFAQPKYDWCECSVKPDFVALPHQSSKYCRPFGRDYSIKKESSITSERRHYQFERINPLELRKEITEIFKDAGY